MSYNIVFINNLADASSVAFVDGQPPRCGPSRRDARDARKEGERGFHALQDLAARVPHDFRKMAATCVSNAKEHLERLRNLDIVDPRVLDAQVAAIAAITRTLEEKVAKRREGDAASSRTADRQLKAIQQMKAKNPYPVDDTGHVNFRELLETIEQQWSGADAAKRKRLLDRARDACSRANPGWASRGSSGPAHIDRAEIVSISGERATVDGRQSP
ncbi:hypothetical protein [Roseateles sp. L2-2]|uniref:hypothetical protein n=1 Tax=Roseateles sp. L2-2 TaxID=3422597 RepID=UPI003D36123F